MLINLKSLRRADGAFAKGEILKNDIFLFRMIHISCIDHKKWSTQEIKMLELLCGKDPVDLGIKTYEGWNITAFLDHLSSCEKCSRSQDTLIKKLNSIIGGGERSENS